MTVKLAIADYSFPKLEWDQALRLISDLGMPAVDIGLFVGRSHLRPEDMFREPVAKAAARVTTALSAHNLQIADVFGQPGSLFQERAVNHPDKNERQEAADFFWRVLEFATRCNAKHISLLPGIHFQDEEYEASIQRCAQELRWRASAAAQMGIVLAVEPHVGSIIATPAQAINLMDQTPGLTLTLDYSHFISQGIPSSEIDPLVRFASHFHARCACKGKLQSSFKENTIDYRCILNTMVKVKYIGYVVLEYVWMEFMRCNEVDILTETIQLRDWLRAIDESCRVHVQN